jgi:hypothetical protein
VVNFPTNEFGKKIYKKVLKSIKFYCDFFLRTDGFDGFITHKNGDLPDFFPEIISVI